MTPTDLLNVLSVLIVIGGGNTSSVNLSYSYLKNTLNRVAKKISSTIKDEWKSPEKIVVQGDDKMSVTLDGFDKKNVFLL